MRILLLLFFFVSSLAAVIVPAPTLEVVEKELATCQEDALVVFDIDHTLVTFEDQVMTPLGVPFLDAKFKGVSKEERHRLFSIILKGAAPKLITPDIHELMADLKRRRIKTMACSAAYPQKMGTIDDMMGWRLQQLATLHYDFSHSFNHKLLSFSDLTSSPLFKDGVMHCGKTPKGIALRAFFERVGFRPTKVYFVDDRLDYIASVEEEMEKMGIDHVSFHYTEANNFDEPFDECWAREQWDHLIKHGEWLSS